MRILIVEDDAALCRSLKARLTQQNFEVTVANDGEEGLFYILENSHDLVLLDRMLPGLDGTTVLKKARESGCSVPIIFLTALGSLEDRITGLDEGADDYLVKPFDFDELMARIRCVCRRPRQLTDTSCLTLGDLTFYPEQNLLTCGGRSCTLSRREGELLTLFLKNPGQIVPRATILLRVWGPDSDIEEGNLDNYIHFLRRRLKSVLSHVELKTARGVGYYMQEVDSHCSAN